MCFNLFLANVPILYPLKTPEKLWFYGVFGGYKMETLARNRLIIYFDRGQAVSLHGLLYLLVSRNKLCLFGGNKVKIKLYTHNERNYYFYYYLRFTILYKTNNKWQALQLFIPYHHRIYSFEPHLKKKNFLNNMVNGEFIFDTYHLIKKKCKLYSGHFPYLKTQSRSQICLW